MAAIVALALALAVVVIASVRFPRAVGLVLAACGFVVLAPIVFVLHMAGLGDFTGVERMEAYLAVSAWLPLILSFAWFVMRVAKRPRSFLDEIRPHILYRQPPLAVFIGSALPLIAYWEVQVKTDEILNMSLFALVVFIICAWFLPYVLRPMFKLRGRSDEAVSAIAALLGLILSLMIALAAFKGRGYAEHVNDAINRVIEAVAAFIVAALTGAGALLALQQSRAGRRAGQPPRPEDAPPPASLPRDGAPPTS